MTNCKYCKADCIFRGEQQTKECKGYIPMTNADRIRAMSDEELAELLSNEVPHDCAYCNLVCATFDGDKFAGSCQNAFYRWLQQPAKGE